MPLYRIFERAVDRFTSPFTVRANNSTEARKKAKADGWRGRFKVEKVTKKANPSVTKGKKIKVKAVKFNRNGSVTLYK